MVIRLLIADPDSAMRRTVAALLDSQKDMKVVGQAADGRQAVVVAQRSRPDVVLLSDLLANRECIEIIKATKPAARVVVLATYRESVLGSLAAGADECVLKDSGTERLAAAIRLAVARRSRLDVPPPEERDIDRPPGPTTPH